MNKLFITLSILVFSQLAGASTEELLKKISDIIETKEKTCIVQSSKSGTPVIAFWYACGVDAGDKAIRVETNVGLNTAGIILIEKMEEKGFKLNSSSSDGGTSNFVFMRE